MSANLPLMACNDDKTFVPPISANPFFWQQNQSFFVKTALPDVKILNFLASRVSQKPKCLLTHVQRIYFCYQALLSEQLYAALVDFLIILNKRGEAISRQMVSRAVSILSTEQSATLVNYIQDPKADTQLLVGNHYSIFSKGVIGVALLVQYAENIKQGEVDPLSLAQDFIEYSQLTEAQAVLEAAILKQPDRLELHEELLGLYQSTRNADDFRQMMDNLTGARMAVPDAWQKLSAYFEGLQ
ncbi:MAG: hypothetical protein ABL903_15670 [Methylococcales bacterium]